MGQMKPVPSIKWGWCVRALGNEFIPGIEGGSPAGPDTSCQDIEEEQASRHLPPATIAHGGATPHMGAESISSPCDGLRRFLDAFDGDLGLCGGPLDGKSGIQCLQRTVEGFEIQLVFRIFVEMGQKRCFLVLWKMAGFNDFASFAEKGAPVDPTSNEFPVVQVVLNQMVGDGEQDGGF